MTVSASPAAAGRRLETMRGESHYYNRPGGYRHVGSEEYGYGYAAEQDYGYCEEYGYREQELPAD